MTAVKERAGSAVLDASRKVYETSLAFYPHDLREEFGEEMVEVFEEQVAEAYQERGLPGVFRIWWCTAREFVVINLTPRRLVPVFAAVTALVLMVWLAGFMANPMAMGKSCGHTFRFVTFKYR